MRAPGADSASRLVSTMVDVLVAELAETGRLRRGRLYARQGAVADLTVAPGVVSASIQGSRPQPYVATARVPLTRTDGDKLTALVPARREIRFECSCPDDDAPCKHAVALMATFSERLAYDIGVFLRWRTGTSELGGAPDDGALADEPVEPAIDEAARAELAAFLGAGLEALPPAPALPTLPAPRAAWDEVWAEMLTAALEAMRRPPSPLRRR